VRLATWNVNSIRSRVDRVTDWLARADVDVLAMQETKCTDAQFPSMPFAALGYDVAHVGFNQWNGVAIASRVGLANVELGFDGQPEWNDVAEARAIGATCGGVRVWSLYIPNGRTVEDPHYAYKLEWLAALDETAKGWLADDPATPIALTGDWNIAPTDDDVWDISLFDGSTHVTEPERKALEVLREAGLRDVVPRALKYDRPYTYWDYRQLAFPKNNGMRIDLVYADATFADAVTDAYVDREARKGKGPSDHAPVVVDLAV
jgi:exodeoxyribonuclease-3